MRLAWLMHTALPPSLPPYLHPNRRSTWQEGTQDVWVDYRVAELYPPHPRFHLGTSATRGRRRRKHPPVKGQHEWASQASRASWWNLAHDKCVCVCVCVWLREGCVGSVWQPSIAPPCVRIDMVEPGTLDWQNGEEEWNKNWMDWGMKRWLNRLVWLVESCTTIDLSLSHAPLTYCC